MAQPEEQGHSRSHAQYNSESFEIPDLEENSKEEQFADLDLYMAHHNTYEASQHICQEYRSHLHDLDDDQYYTTGHIIHRIHWLHKIIGWQTNQQNHEGPWKSLREYLAEAEVKPGEKSCMVIDHLAQNSFLTKSHSVQDQEESMTMPKVC